MRQRNDERRRWPRRRWKRLDRSQLTVIDNSNTKVKNIGWIDSVSAFVLHLGARRRSRCSLRVPPPRRMRPARQVPQTQSCSCSTVSVSTVSEHGWSRWSPLRVDNCPKKRNDSGMQEDIQLQASQRATQALAQPLRDLGTSCCRGMRPKDFCAASSSCLLSLLL
jgi:hypothetical protein